MRARAVPRARRVVVTGLGLVTSLGIGWRENWDSRPWPAAAAPGRSTTSSRSTPTTTIACEVKGFEPTDFIDRRSARRMDRFAQLAVAAGRLALEDASLDVTDGGLAPRIGAVVGSGIGGLESFVAQTLVVERPRARPRVAALHPDGDRRTWPPRRSRWSWG